MGQTARRRFYYYDANGQRTLAVRKSPAGTYERARFWFGETEVHYNGTGAESKVWVHVSLGGLPIARIENRTNLEFTHHSRLGSLLVADDASGNIKGGFTYGPWGEILDAVGQPDEHTRRMNGKEADDLTGLSYYGFRYYDPLSLSWTQADPKYRFVPDAAWDEPRRANLFAFSGQNPLRFVDPDGRERQMVCIGHERVGNLVCDGGQFKGPPTNVGPAARRAGNAIAGALSDLKDAVEGLAEDGKDVANDVHNKVTKTAKSVASAWVDGGQKVIHSPTSGAGLTVLGITFALPMVAATAGTGGTVATLGVTLLSGPSDSTKKPVRRVYEHNPKHKDQAYVDSRGRTVSRRPRGDCQGMLDVSVQKKPTSDARVGVEPSTGLTVEFRMHLRQDGPTLTEVIEFFHGFVPED